MKTRAHIALFRRYHTTIWIRVVGTVLTKICEFMLKSFIGIYIYEQLGQDLFTSALATIVAPVTMLLVSFSGGSLSDRFGRKPVMIAAVLIQAIAHLGYAYGTNFWHFVGLSFLSGLANALYWPAANAQVADLVREELRGEVFALMHTSLNIGAAIGPLLGIVIYKSNPLIAFAVCSVGLLFYALLLAYKTTESAPQIVPASELPRPKKPSPWKIDKTYFSVLLMTAVSVPVAILYGQTELILPQQLKASFPDYLSVFALMMSLNGASVTFLQMPIQKLTERFPVPRALFVAYLLMALTALGYARAGTVASILAAEFLFTLGEMINGPQLQRVIAAVAPPPLRGRYFSIQQMSWGLGGILGPTLGSLALMQIGGSPWFFALALALTLAGFAQFALVRRMLRKRS